MVRLGRAAERFGVEALQIKRRTFLASVLTTGIALPRLAAMAAASTGFGFETVQSQALARIKFRPEQALWRDGGLFQIRPLHRGFQYEHRVSINLVDNGEVREVPYDPAQFDFGDNKLATAFDASLGFAGLGLYFPLDRPNDFDEFAVFLGASYFRLRGRGQRYGASARCLAIDTAGPQGEEFPMLTAFWLERPAADAASLTLYAVLDSKSAAGAYKFVFTPGMKTRVEVEATLYPRLDIKKLGLAPVNSMFLHGKPGNRPFADIRPEAHDSDMVLLYRGNGEWLSRPLLNPRLLRVSDFFDEQPKGFGLVQRETDIRQYQDPAKRFEARPSLWVEPTGDWSSGMVELIEIPSDDEINDNIAAYWVPKQPAKAETTLSFAYHLTALPGAPPLAATGRCVATRTGPLTPADTQREPHDRALRFWLDFAGGELANLSDQMPVEAVITISSGKTSDIECRKLDSGMWRVAFTFTPDGRKDSEMRAYLRLRTDALSETWTYRLTPD
jgi:glucans biosynthesis protein